MDSAISGSLPGGILLGGQVCKQFSFKSLEQIQPLLLRLQAEPCSNFPALISEFLFNALDSLGNQPASLDAVRCLSVGDRQFLMRELAAQIDANPLWVHLDCTSCKGKMDVCFRYADLPIKHAAAEFPQFTLRLGKKTLQVRVPNGADQEAIAALPHGEPVLEFLLQRIAVPTGKNSTDFNWDSALADAVEAAVEAASPELGTILVTPCPHCAAENRVEVDLYAFIGRAGREWLLEIHQIASAYHWTEEQILALPPQRRKYYLALIDRARGLTSGV